MSGDPLSDILSEPAAPLPRSANSIQVINRAARILRTLRGEPAGLSLGAIATRVDLPRSTVQRIVGALVAEGLLMAASPGGRVRLGTELLSLAAGARMDIVELCHPHLKALSEASGETVDLAMLQGDHLIFVDQVVGSHRLRAVSAVGETFPLHSTANGKACLAAMDDDQVRAILAGCRLALGSGDARSIDDLLDELALVRQSGVAFDNEEHSLGISALGVAFKDRLGSIYAVSIPVPSGRFAQNRGRLVALIRDMHETLTRVLVY
ncbi:MAG: IclR family transcriptional regulator [Hyphomicrobiales bacterium]|nr:IclR family transcriptional regulator [Hyphomicrobiales bacterium]